MCKRVQEYAMQAMDKDIEAIPSPHFRNGNYDVHTTHSLVRKAMDYRAHFDERRSNNDLPISAVRAFLVQHWVPSSPKDIRYVVAETVRSALDRYMASADEQLSIKHFSSKALLKIAEPMRELLAKRAAAPAAAAPAAAAASPANIQGMLVAAAQQLWIEVTAGRHELPLPHNAYLKWFVLQKPKLRTFKNRPYDLIIVDEAQDLNAVTTQLVMDLQEEVPLVLLGDKRQQLYAFNYACGLMSGRIRITRPVIELCLRHSYRFGIEIAAAINAILKAAFDEQDFLVGHEEQQESDPRVHPGVVYCLLPQDRDLTNVTLEDIFPPRAQQAQQPQVQPEQQPAEQPQGQSQVQGQEQLMAEPQPPSPPQQLAAVPGTEAGCEQRRDGGTASSTGASSDASSSGNNAAAGHQNDNQDGADGHSDGTGNDGSSGVDPGDDPSGGDAAAGAAAPRRPFRFLQCPIRGLQPDGGFPLELSMTSPFPGAGVAVLPASLLLPGAPRPRVTLVARRNATLVLLALQLVTAGHTVCASFQQEEEEQEGGRQGRGFGQQGWRRQGQGANQGSGRRRRTAPILQRMADVYEFMYHGKRFGNGSGPHVLSGIETSEELLELVDSGADMELCGAYQVVRQLMARDPACNVTEQVARLTSELVDRPCAADYHLTTAHKMKGREAAVVQLAEDFVELSPTEEGGKRKLQRCREEPMLVDELNAIYVAVSRAKSVLLLNRDLSRLLLGLHQRHMQLRMVAQQQRPAAVQEATGTAAAAAAVAADTAAVAGTPPRQVRSAFAPSPDAGGSCGGLLMSGVQASTPPSTALPTLPAAATMDADAGWDAVTAAAVPAATASMIVTKRTTDPMEEEPQRRTQVPTAQDHSMAEVPEEKRGSREEQQRNPGGELAEAEAPGTAAGLSAQQGAEGSYAGKRRVCDGEVGAEGLSQHVTKAQRCEGSAGGPSCAVNRMIAGDVGNSEGPVQAEQSVAGAEAAAEAGMGPAAVEELQAADGEHGTIGRSCSTGSSSGSEGSAVGAEPEGVDGVDTDADTDAGPAAVVAVAVAGAAAPAAAAPDAAAVDAVLECCVVCKMHLVRIDGGDAGIRPGVSGARPRVLWRGRPVCFACSRGSVLGQVVDLALRYPAAAADVEEAEEPGAAGAAAGDE
ncbi:hypothetical protein Agub_g4506 [Astrephomene gubernaculifera]|uniref:UvrD-like helicase ATP-binding domain-containing protein n=1 Tax=Astrephomene gubernaculifera TaxID=47775 RepID=A0AAD3DK83_9CHLO|nr:hypothetical protein Agub_g4506 [Astrephomene gubernaculifera]